MSIRTLFPAVLLLALAIPASASPLTGRASVIDGDTIDIAGERIRFDGIDAPESRQTCLDAQGASYRCGQVSAEALNRFLAKSRPTRCTVNNRDRYGRWIGVCYRSDGANVNAWLVRNGYALDWPRYSEGAYAEAQDAAEAERSGIWAGTFDLPWKWRRR